MRSIKTVWILVMVLLLLLLSVYQKFNKKNWEKIDKFERKRITRQVARKRYNLCARRNRKGREKQKRSKVVNICIRIQYLLQNTFFHSFYCILCECNFLFCYKSLNVSHICEQKKMLYVWIGGAAGDVFIYIQSAQTKQTAHLTPIDIYLFATVTSWYCIWIVIIKSEAKRNNNNKNSSNNEYE